MSRHVRPALLCTLLASLAFAGQEKELQLDEAKKPHVGEVYAKKATWPETMSATRANYLSGVKSILFTYASRGFGRRVLVPTRRATRGAGRSWGQYTRGLRNVKEAEGQGGQASRVWLRGCERPRGAVRGRPSDFLDTRMT
jgi:hypothetical protein